MKRIAISVVTCFTMALFAPPVTASCTKDGNRSQFVALSAGSKHLERWEVRADEIHRISLPNGFALGVKIEPMSAEKYRETLAKTKTPAYDEMVKISIYDLGGPQPKLLTHTYGGANSMQGYGPRGGADRVDAVGEPGIELWLHNPVCVRANDFASKQ